MYIVKRGKILVILTFILFRNIVHMFTTGEGVLKQVDGVTTDGLQQIFATNLFGHFVLVKEIEELFGKHGSQTQVIWTSSSNAKKDSFSFQDIQHAKG